MPSNRLELPETTVFSALMCGSNPSIKNRLITVTIVVRLTMIRLREMLLALRLISEIVLVSHHNRILILNNC